MAKIRSVFLIFIFCFFCFTLSFVGCKRNFVYPYMYDITQIVEIKIGVKKEETVNNISIDDRYDIKTEIVDKEEFFKDFENLKFNYNFPGDLITIKPNEYVIIFIYENGNSEEVHLTLIHI